MPFRIKVSLFVIAFLVVLVFVVPMLVPVPAAPGTQPLAALARNAEYVNVAGVDLHVQVFPADGPEAPGAEPLFVLLHDYAFSSYTFAEFGPVLTAYGTAVAFDRPGFGLSERPLPSSGRYDVGFDPYTSEAQVRLTVGLLDQLGAGEAILIGNGVGGRVALEVAMAHPERVAGLVLLSTPAFVADGREAPGWFLNSPQMRKLGPVFLRQLAEAPGEQLLLGAFHDDAVVTDELRAAHAVTTSVDDWDRALWEISRVGRAPSLEGRLDGVGVPVLVVAGEPDTSFPAEDAERLTAELRNAQLVTLSGCGRIPQLECPEVLTDVLHDWLTATGLASRR
ncbi:MAG: alpha/beta hydrolase [Trueperaceae bacterium]|jgi:pimeloyl-ACP methyl ester carboxylesterase